MLQSNVMSYTDMNVNSDNTDVEAGDDGLASQDDDNPPSLAKGQLISECLFDFFLIFQKTKKKFDKFLPQNLKSGQIIK